MKKSKLLHKKTTHKLTTSHAKARWPRVLSVATLFISLFLMIAFISYMYTWKVDQDKVLHFRWTLLWQQNVPISNWLGRLGAILSNQFFFWGFGMASFGFVLYGILTSGLLYFRFQWDRFWVFTKYLLLSLFYFPLVLEFLFHSQDFPWGGAVGLYLYEWTSVFLGWLGTLMIIVFVGIGVAVWHDKLIPGSKVSFQTLRTFWIKSWTKAQSLLRSSVHEMKKTTEEYMQEKEMFEPDSQETISEELAHEESPETVDFETGIIQSDSAPVEDDIPSEEEDLEDMSDSHPLERSDDTNFEISIPTPEEPKNVPLETQATPVLINKELEEKLDNLEPYDPTADLSNYKRPEKSLLLEYADSKLEIDRSELEENKNQIVRTLEHYKIKIEKIRATIGPTVTLYEIIPEPGVRISKIKNLEDDIALSLAALGIRIIAPIPGKGTIGIEVPNKKKQIVGLRELLDSDAYKNAKMDLPIALGKTISNEVFVADLAKMPHLLIAGATGQGKSVGINTVISSLLYKKHPSQLKLVLIDPKKVELFPYSKLDKHFLAYMPGEEEPIITDTQKVVRTLNSLCLEMDSRYDLLKKAHSRNIKEYNQKFIARKLNPNNGHDYMPFIVLIVDEFADLIMTAGKEVELPIARLAQLSRAVGIHLIIATQRPSVNIITGVIKANFPARLAFKVTSKVDSRTILDTGGADQLIGRGDMLLSQGGGELTRIQCAFIDTPEVEAVIDSISSQRGYAEPFYLPEYEGDESEKDPSSISAGDLDPYFEEAAKLIIGSQHGSTSMIQRRMKLGYNRAGRIMDQLEAFGIVGENQGSKARDVLFQSEMELEEHLDSIRKAAQA